MRVRPDAVVAPETWTRRRDTVRKWLVRKVYRFGWRLAARLPTRLVSVIISAFSWVAVRRNGVHIRTLRRNLAYASGEPVGNDLVRAAVKSYLRSFYEVLALPAWSETDIRGRVRAINESAVREAFAGSGAVVALPHSGNWDLAGAWACVTGMPVTTVVEQLPPEEFAAFLTFRERLGMQVLSHRDPQVLSDLIEAIRRRRVVCLLADRDLAGSGVPVTWLGQRITMPAGPAVVARRTGAALLPAVCQFINGGMAIIIGNQIASRPGRDGLVAMMQEVADFFADTMA
ncbi:MAG TPA: phosphatidylinositol mannoside acyltransferase, partial [Propionibacteriaceae bacterium]|nr:phosphatidylinositol mannoside acyltransferase [Propionibacteriaceae bacterium]